MISSGTRVRFNDGIEYADKYGIILSVIPRRYRAEDLVYRIQIEGYPKPGGWNGKVTAMADWFTVVGGSHASGNAVKAKARPYGSR